MYLGIDLGSSSIKLSLLSTELGSVVASVTYPEVEMKIDAPKPGWAEQDPEVWWHNFLTAYKKLLSKPDVNSEAIKGIGISYQMHGLVMVDENQKVLRPSIIWCDSRAVEMGNKIYETLGQSYCLNHLLNSPGNFTASKLAWVKENEPEIFSKMDKFMLPGDFIAMKLSKKVTTTEAGFSEGVFWDFENQELNDELLGHLGLEEHVIPDTVPAIGGNVSVDSEVAQDLGLNEDVKINYRSGDQPNNAFSLNVLNPGEVAATAGTSGVIYAVTDKNVHDRKSRINTFLHINNTVEQRRNGILICINGTGILYSWLRKLLNTSKSNLPYNQMNELAGQVEEGAEGVRFFPFGNGAERVLENEVVGAHLLNMDFNQHDSAHIIRAGLEGIVYALNIGFEMLADMDVPVETIRVGHSNLFLSSAFRQIFANVTNTTLELYDTDGAAGAARGAALGDGFYENAEEAFKSLKRIEVIKPDENKVKVYKDLYAEWKTTLDEIIQTEDQAVAV
ncbi:MAG: carbohydrate kinase [Balneola sp.]|jgi:xylulokinase|nr:carbohydrate kinase [Balneola sp.]MBE79946.1 carbohydrate kinase [Balneola sp.]HBX66427.1 carbohydrate kinase [Balneolaceae bacterium]|tara:strand:+ start:862 stop:2376 length:1515 start_codon:yes stop_codon:yes gene_type:complete